MKTMLSTIFVCAILQAVWLSLSTGDAGTDCSLFGDNQTGCCEANCTFINCTLQNDTVIAQCYNSSEDATCKNPDEIKDICNGTAPAVDECNQYNETTCCTVTGCVFYSCNDTKRTAVCVNSTADNATICDDGSAPSDVCAAEVTTPGPTTQPPKPKTSTTPSNTSSAQPITTPAASTEKPTQSPSTGGGGSSGQHFDAASFIGGIVLCAGLLAIAYFGFKFYKARTERNYHTL